MKAVARRSRPGSRLARYLFPSFMLAHGLAGQPLSLALDPAAGAPGGAVSVNIKLGAGAAQPAGLQFTLTYSSQAINAVARFAGAEAVLAGKTLTCMDAEAALKCLLVGLNTNLIAPGVVARVNLQISDAADEGVSGLDFADVVAVSPDGDLLPIASSGSLLSVRGDAGPAFSPADVVNAASLRGGSVAPGELITIFGSGMGPAFGAYGSSTSDGMLETAVAGVRVLFDGRPAPLIFMRSDQVNAVAPYEISGSAITEVMVEYQGRASGVVSLPVVEASPALFTADSSGRGPGAIINQDSSINTSANPAAPGSIIALYATGAGEMTPAAVTGKIASDPLPKPSLPISVSIGGITAGLVYAGALSNAVYGVVQINVRVPNEAAPGNLPVILTAGSVSSPVGVTVAVGKPIAAAGPAESRDRR
jgi:uncharacterized protein (TIGR03437 family)